MSEKNYKRTKTISRKPENLIKRDNLIGLKKTHSMIAQDIEIGKKLINIVAKKVAKERKKEKRAIIFGFIHRKRIVDLKKEYHNLVDFQIKIKRVIPFIQQNISKLMEEESNVSVNNTIDTKNSN